MGFPKENDLHMMGFPHLFCMFSGGYITDIVETRRCGKTHCGKQKPIALTPSRLPIFLTLGAEATNSERWPRNQMKFHDVKKCYIK